MSEATQTPIVQQENEGSAQPVARGTRPESSQDPQATAAEAQTETKQAIHEAAAAAQKGETTVIIDRKATIEAHKNHVLALCAWTKDASDLCKRDHELRRKKDELRKKKDKVREQNESLKKQVQEWKERRGERMKLWHQLLATGLNLYAKELFPVEYIEGIREGVRGYPIDMTVLENPPGDVLGNRLMLWVLLGSQCGIEEEELRLALGLGDGWQEQSENEEERRCFHKSWEQWNLVRPTHDERSDDDDSSKDDDNSDEDERSVEEKGAVENESSRDGAK